MPRPVLRFARACHAAAGGGSSAVKALAACRKHGRRSEALGILARMGGTADTRACNEVLHLLQRGRDYDGASALWSAMRAISCPPPQDEDVAAAVAALPAILPDERSFHYMLKVCATWGSWAHALQLLSDMEATGGSVVPHSGHYHSALLAFTRDRSWDGALALVRRTPPSMFATNAFLARLALQTCAEAAAPDTAAAVLAVVPSKYVGTEAHASWLLAGRRAASPGAIRAAWASLERSGVAPDEQCLAQAAAGLLEVAGAASGASAAEAAAREAMQLVRRGVAELPAERAAVVLMAALGAAVDAREVAAAREVMRALHAGGSALRAWEQLQVLQVCAETGAWQELADEAREARRRGLSANGDALAPHWSALERTLVSAAATDDDVAAALRELRALKDAGETAPAEDSSVDAQLIRKYSRSLSMPADAREPLEVLYEDDDLLAVSKPSGELSHPRHRFEGGAILNRVIAHLGRTPFGLHRLDQPTSGVMLFGKSRLAARNVAEQFSARRLRKQYLAVLCGSPDADAFSVDAPIMRHPHVSKLSLVATAAHTEAGLGAEAARAALTHFQVLRRAPASVLCSVRPVTGRMHQIRAHACHVGHPVVGDGLYPGAVQQPQPLSPRLLLHAHSLELAHPRGGQRVRIVAPLPPEFSSAMETLGFVRRGPRLAGVHLDM
jgi:RluA family pseudouridine synthase